VVSGEYRARCRS